MRVLWQDVKGWGVLGCALLFTLPAGGLVLLACRMLGVGHG